MSSTRANLLAIMGAAALLPTTRSDLIADIDAGFFDDILDGQPASFAAAITMPPDIGTFPDLRDFIPNHRSQRGFKVGGSSKQHHTRKRSKDARKARAATRRSQS